MAARPLSGSHRVGINLCYNLNKPLKILFLSRLVALARTTWGSLSPLSWALISLEKSFQGQNEGSQSPFSSTIIDGEREGLEHLTSLMAPVWFSLRGSKAPWPLPQSQDAGSPREIHSQHACLPGLQQSKKNSLPPHFPTSLSTPFSLSFSSVCSFGRGLQGRLSRCRDGLEDPDRDWRGASSNTPQARVRIPLVLFRS